MRLVTLFAIASAIVLPMPALADQVRFTGQTTANAILVRDALQNILRVSAATKNCSALTDVTAVILSPGYEPKNVKYRVGTGKVVYESWAATLCGKQSKFLVSFWPASEGGTMFAIGDPYPDDAPEPYRS